MTILDAAPIGFYSFDMRNSFSSSKSLQDPEPILGKTGAQITINVTPEPVRTGLAARAPLRETVHQRFPRLLLLRRPESSRKDMFYIENQSRRQRNLRFAARTGNKGASAL